MTMFVDVTVVCAGVAALPIVAQATKKIYNRFGSSESKGTTSLTNRLHDVGVIKPVMLNEVTEENLPNRLPSKFESKHKQYTKLYLTAALDKRNIDISVGNILMLDANQQQERYKNDVQLAFQTLLTGLQNYLDMNRHRLFNEQRLSYRLFIEQVQVFADSHYVLNFSERNYEADDIKLERFFSEIFVDRAWELKACMPEDWSKTLQMPVRSMAAVYHNYLAMKELSLHENSMSILQDNAHNLRVEH